MKYSEWYEVWINNYVVPYDKPQTVERYDKIFRHHILPIWGDRELNDITAFDVQSVIAKKQGDDLSNGYINFIFTVFEGSLNTANEAGLRNGTIRVRKLKKSPKKIEALSRLEQEKIQNHILKTKNNESKDYRFGIILAMHSGLRIGELLALKWKDVDLENGTITVNKTVLQDGRISTPKTETSYRTIFLSEKIKGYLQEIKNRSKGDYVVSKKGKPTSIRAYQALFDRMLKKLDIPHKGFHALRHTFATRALECGMDVRTLADLLGHKNASMTLNVYAHSTDETKRESVSRLGCLIY